MPAAVAPERQPLLLPPGTAIYWQVEAGRPCDPAKAYMWTYSGAKTWYYIARVPLPGRNVMALDAPDWVAKWRHDHPGAKPIYSGTGKLIKEFEIIDAIGDS
jgi:hypothetical protein